VKMEQILKDLDNAVTLESYEKASDAILEYLKTASEEDRVKIGGFYEEHSKRLLKESQDTRQKSRALIEEYYSLAAEKK
jgi:hypothetical protein